MLVSREGTGYLLFLNKTLRTSSRSYELNKKKKKTITTQRTQIAGTFNYALASSIIELVLQFNTLNNIQVYIFCFFMHISVVSIKANTVQTLFIIIHHYQTIKSFVPRYTYNDMFIILCKLYFTNECKDKKCVGVLVEEQ